MASAWADGIPVVTVATTVPKPVTFIYPFYQAHRFLDRQIETWRGYPADVRKHLSAIVVDDGSPTPAVLPDERPFPMQLFRISVDVPWNWLAARNIGAHHAADGWLLMTDMDHVVPVETARALVYGKHNPNLAYAFQRREHTGVSIAPHSASFFLTRETFWRTGGYDEALSGHYGTDGEFRRRLRKTAPVQVLSDVLERHEYVDDSSTTCYARKRPEDAEAVKRLVSARTEHWAPKTLSFPYVEATC